jgi:hypothetical protein
MMNSSPPDAFAGDVICDMAAILLGLSRWKLS